MCQLFLINVNGIDDRVKPGNKMCQLFLINVNGIDDRVQQAENAVTASP